MSKATDAAQQQLQLIQQFMQQYGNLSQNYNNGSNDRLNDFLGSTGTFSNPLFGAQGTNALLGNLTNFASQLGGPLNPQVDPSLKPYLDKLSYASDRSKDIVTSQGQTNDTIDLKDQLSKLVGGQDAISQTLLKPNQDVIANKGWNPWLTNLAAGGNDIVSKGGQTADSSQAMAGLQSLLSGGGMTPAIQALLGSSQGLVSNGGMTAPLAQLMGDYSKGVASGGMTADSKAIMAAAMKIINANGAGGALLPMDTVLSMARDQVAQQNNQLVSQYTRDAQNRYGSAVSGGNLSTSNALADQAFRASANAQQNAATTQQGLQLQQLQGAFGTAADVSRTAASLLASYNAMGGDIARSASSNLQAGIAGMGQAGALANQNIATSAGGINDLLRNINDRLNSGASMVLGANGQANTAFNNANNSLLGLQQNQIGAAGQLNDTIGQEFGREQNANNNLINQAGATSGITQQAYDNALKEKALNFQTYLSTIGATSDIMNQFNAQYLQAAGQQAGIGGQYTSVLPSIMSSYGGVSESLIKAASTPSWWQTLLTTAASSAAGGLAEAGGARLGNTGAKGPCWIAEAIYGVDDPRTHKVRAYLSGPFRKSAIGDAIVRVYIAIGRQVAWFVRRSSILKRLFKPLFDLALAKAEA